MAGSAAVRTTAIARREVRASLERMEFHLARGVRGTKGVNREVNFLNALHRQNALLGGKAVGVSTQIRPVRSFGDDALGALRSADGRTRGRVKSSILADYSADGLEPARKIGALSQPWVWVANSSACPTCLYKHGTLFKGDFVPSHPSCLCIPEQPSPEVRPLKAHEIIKMQRQYGDPRYAKLINDVEAGRKRLSLLKQVENVNATPAGRAAVEVHRAEGVVRQSAIGSQPAPAARVVDDVIEEIVDAVDELGVKITDYGEFKSETDYLKRYAAATSEDEKALLMRSWKSQEEHYLKARRDIRKLREIEEVQKMKLGVNPPGTVRTHLTDLKGDMTIPAAKKVGKQSALKTQATESFGAETLDMSKAGLDRRLKSYVKRVQRDFDIDLDDDVFWTLDWEEWHRLGHPSAEAFVENGRVFLSPSMTRSLAMVDDIMPELRVLSHEIGHATSSMGRKGITNSGLRPIMEEAGAEIQSIFHSRYAWADEMLDGLKTTRTPLLDGSRVDLVGRDSLYWRHNYADDIEEVILQAARRNGWNRQAMLDDILDHYVNADDFESFFREGGETLRIHAGKFRKGRESADDIARARYEKVWDEAPSGVRGYYDDIDSTHDAWGTFTEGSRTVAQEVDEQKRVADLLRWLIEDEDRLAGKLGSRAARLADDAARLADDVLDDLVGLVDDVPNEPLKVFTIADKIEGRPTAANKVVLNEAEQIMADAIGPEHAKLFQDASSRVKRVRVKNNASQKSGTGYYGLWEELQTTTKGRGWQKQVTGVTEQRMTLQMNRNDWTSQQKWVGKHNEQFNRIRNAKLSVKSDDYYPATRTTPQRGTVEFIDNPEYIEDYAKRSAAMDDWVKLNPEPPATYVATSEELAQTYFHELTHVLDYGSGPSTSSREGVTTLLQQKMNLDKIDKLTHDIFTGAGGWEVDPSFWYAAEGWSKNKSAETVAEITRMYFFGDRTGVTYLHSNPLGRTAAEWRTTYPKLARWVEENVLGMDDVIQTNLYKDHPQWGRLLNWND